MALTLERLKEVLTYDPVTGLFRWLPRPASRPSDNWNQKYAGKKAGCVSKIGYVVIRVDDVLYYGHRLAWLYVIGAWPSEQIDHVDVDKANNAWVNLREATNTQNSMNTRGWENKKTGVKGVYTHDDRFRSAIQVNGVQRHLGVFHTKEDAAKAYRTAAFAAFENFSRHE